MTPAVFSAARQTSRRLSLPTAGDARFAAEFSFRTIHGRFGSCACAGCRSTVLVSSNWHAIVALCPALEDIEFFDVAKDDDDDMKFQVKGVVLEPAKHLGSTRTTLKSPCSSVIYSPRRGFKTMSAYSWVVTTPGWDAYLPTGFSTGLSFAEFPALERLEVEQLMLYGPPIIQALESKDAVRDDVALRLAAPRDLLERLPPNLVHLQLGQVDIWSVVLRDMTALCFPGPGGRMYCPRLEMVDVEVSTAPPESEYRFSVEAMAERGVRVSLSHSNISCEAE